MNNWDERGADHLAVKLVVGDEVRDVLAKRHLQLEELQFAIYNAEANNDKMYDSENKNHFLIKSIVGEGVYHVEYTLAEEAGEKAYDIITAYACRTMIKA